MIMPRKKRRLVTGIIIAITLVIVTIITCIVLYITTDLFKTNDTLFNKYASGTFANLNKLFSDENMNEVRQILKNNKYETNLNATIEYKEGEKKDNAVNNIKLIVTGKNDENKKYKYQDISLKNNNEKIYGLEYIENNNKFGIRLNGVQQFVTKEFTVEDENIKDGKEIEQELNVGNKNNILNFISNIDLADVKLTEEENIKLQNKYVEILTKNISKDKFTKQKKMNITINDKKVIANAYVITLTKEQLNDIYIEILNQLKQDDIILAKLEEIEEGKQEYNNVTSDISEKISIKEKFVKRIENRIKEIQNTNIGNDTRKIIVFENDMKPLGMRIETNEYITTILTNENENKVTYEYLKQKMTEKENTVDFKIEKTANKNNDSVMVEHNVVKDNIKTTNYFIKDKKFEKDMVKTILEVYRKNQNAEIKIKSQKEEKLVNEFKEKLEIKKENSINMKELNQEQKNNINNIIKEVENKQLENVSKFVSEKDLSNILEKLELKLEEAEDISSEGISETERNRFNSNFEFYEGEKISKENILKLIENTKNNLGDVRVTKYKEKNESEKNKPAEPKEYKILIKKNNTNEMLASNLLTNIKNTKDNNYNVRIEYSQKNGLVENIFITVNE